MLMAAIDGSGDLPEGWLDEVQADDRLFPLIQPLDWSKVGS
jgi:1,4-alpha-glucan branching enzyme